MKQKLSTKYKLLAAIGIIFITFATSCSFSNDTNKPDNISSNNPNNGSISEVTPSTGNSNTTQTTSNCSTNGTTNDNTTQKPNNSSSTDNTNDSNNTTESRYKLALKKAKSYSDTLHMSKAGIYDQLTSQYGEQFTAEEAQYAVDNLNADFKLNALEKAKSYQKTMNMSKKEIYEQLTSKYGEQFTPEEAQYAIDNLE